MLNLDHNVIRIAKLVEVVCITNMVAPELVIGSTYLAEDYYELAYTVRIHDNEGNFIGTYLRDRFFASTS